MISWVCVLMWLSAVDNAPSMATVPNLASKADCDRVGNAANHIFIVQRVSHVCVQVHNAGEN